MDVNQAIAKRRTIHSFNTKKVSEEYIIQAIKAANYAPCHRLSFPWRFTSINKEKRELLFEIAFTIKYPAEGINQRNKTNLREKFMNSSHLLVASQILKNEVQRFQR